MEIINGVFQTRREAEAVIDELRKSGIAQDRIGLLTPGMSENELEAGIPISDTEGPGTGKAMGAAVGGAFGAATGATLGAAAASLAIPGVGPVIAVGVVAAALIGVAGAATGAVAGEAVEEALAEGLPHEDVYVFEEALRRGRSAVVTFVADADQAATARRIMTQHNSEDLDSIRESWWQTVKENERNNYEKGGSDFERDEISYRRGFEAALNPKRRGKAYPEVEKDLRSKYGDTNVDVAFRQGYERGCAYNPRASENHKD